MDALQNFFFWTWKIGNSTQLSTSSCPMWHYKLGLQQGWIPKGEILLCQSEIPPEILIPTSLNRSKRSRRTLRPNSDLDTNFWWELSFLSDRRCKCHSTTLTAFAVTTFATFLSRQLLIILFLRLAQAHLIPCKAHHTSSPRRQFLPRSQELKFLCYRRIRPQVRWRPCSHRHSQLLQLQLLVRDGIMRMTMTLLMCMFPHYLFSSRLSLTGSFEMLLALSPVARTPSKHHWRIPYWNANVFSSRTTVHGMPCLPRCHPPLVLALDHDI